MNQQIRICGYAQRATRAPQFALKNFFGGGSRIPRLHFYRVRRRKRGRKVWIPSLHPPQILSFFSSPWQKTWRNFFTVRNSTSLSSPGNYVFFSLSLSPPFPLTASDFKHIPNQEPTGSQTCEPHPPHILTPPSPHLLTFLSHYKKASRGFYFISCSKSG